jgi:hypothetical protein
VPICDRARVGGGRWSEVGAPVESVDLIDEAHVVFVPINRGQRLLLDAGIRLHDRGQAPHRTGLGARGIRACGWGEGAMSYPCPTL